jgi:hypothetical protein
VRNASQCAHRSRYATQTGMRIAGKCATQIGARIAG